MSLTAQEIIEVMTKAKEMGVTQLKVDGLEISVGKELPGFPVKETAPIVLTDKEIAALVAAPSPFDNLTEEEIQYYATPYFDVLQEKKRAMAEQRKEDEALK